jgi:hypothetical protein
LHGAFTLIPAIPKARTTTPLHNRRQRGRESGNVSGIAEEAGLALPKLIKDLKLNKLFISLNNVRPAAFWQYNVGCCTGIIINDLKI